MGLFGNHARVGASAAGAYEIERSLRFNSADSAVLIYTPGGAGDSRQMTFSFWTKRGSLGGDSVTNYIWTAWNGSNTDRISFTSDDQLQIELKDGSSTEAEWHTDKLFRDVSAWYHVVIAFDTEQAATDDRMKLYINGTLITDFDLKDTVGQNYDLEGFNTTNEHSIGRYQSGSTGGNTYFNGYMTEIYFIDGAQKAATDFGETDLTTGQWVPKKYAGTYGTRGFYLDFADNSNTTAATLGKDSSGNSNNVTPTNFSVAAGVGNDSLVDTPTNNYATLTPLKGYSTTFTAPTNGNLDYSLGGLTNQVYSSTAVGPSGKWYFEITATTAASGRYCLQTPEHTAQWDQAFAVVPQSDVREIKRGSSTIYSSITSISDGDIIGIALDCDNNTAQAYMDGTSLGAAFSLDTVAPDKIYHLMIGRNSSGGGSPAGSVNFGQRPFSHQPSTDFKAWNTANLPIPTINKGGDYFKAKTYSGNGSTQAITGLGFSPNLVTCKRRDGSGDNQSIFDTVRGATKELITNGPGAEGTCATCLTSFDADGFTLGNNGGMNGSGETYVAWNWKESTSAGFDIVSYTGTGSATTVAHNLGVVPDVVIVKNRDVADGWQIQHVAKGPTFTQQMDGAGAFEDNDTVWNDTAPTSSTFAVGNDDKTNASGEKYIAYVWSGVEGYSKFGYYVANGNSNGNFIYTGFAPSMVWIKNVGSGENWEIWDTARDPFNVVTKRLQTNTDGGEASSTFFDFLSNGIKLRNTSGGYNSSGNTFVYLCFGESPFKYANAR